MHHLKKTLQKKGYDTARLEAFLPTEGRAMLVDLSLAYYDVAANKLPPSELNNRCRAIAERHQLHWSIAKADERPAVLEGIADCATQILVKTLRHADGTPIDREEADAIFSGKDEPSAEGQPGNAADEDKWDFPPVPLFGVYPWLRIFQGPEQFEFALELPGKIIETNGIIVDPTHSLWRFTADETFPTGYRMSAHSVVLDKDAQRKVLGRVIVDDAPSANRFVRLVGHEGLLFEAVQDVFASGKLDAIHQLDPDAHPELRARIKSLKTWFGVDLIARSQRVPWARGGGGRAQIPLRRPVRPRCSPRSPSRSVSRCRVRLAHVPVRAPWGEIPSASKSSKINLILRLLPIMPT